MLMYQGMSFKYEKNKHYWLKWRDAHKEEYLEYERKRKKRENDWKKVKFEFLNILLET